VHLTHRHGCIVVMSADIANCQDRGPGRVDERVAPSPAYLRLRLRGLVADRNVQIVCRARLREQRSLKQLGHGLGRGGGRYGPPPPPQPRD
jgi:hypothetical protein